ncbi:MAG: hypothetical protein HUJ78_06085 [Mogibacterium sp.]|nr:hypothetical protein [Mogibacterium sp.]
MLSVDRDGTENVAVGTFPDISAGEYIEFTGEYAVHPRFGEQVRAVTAKAVMPEDADSLELLKTCVKKVNNLGFKIERSPKWALTSMRIYLLFRKSALTY